MAQKNPMRRTGAAWLTVVMLVALYATVVRLESASAVSYPTSFTQARLPTTQRVQSLVIRECSFPLLESLPAQFRVPGVRRTRLLCLPREPLRSFRT